MSRQEIEDACQQDTEIKALITAIRTNNGQGKLIKKTRLPASRDIPRRTRNTI